MIITAANLAAIFTGYKASFAKGFQGAESTYEKIAMTVPSSTAEETYAWLGQFPKLREWIGERIVHNLVAHGYTIKNRKFEVTVSVPREKMEDDQYHVFGPLFENMGLETKQHPDRLIYELLASGFAAACYDGKPFFAIDHPVGTTEADTVPVSNMQAGAGLPWFLLAGGHPFKPLVLQKRQDYAFQSLDSDSDPNVFWKDEYIYGVRARLSAGFGLWQLAYASKAPLTHENYEAARTAMKAFKGDEGKKLGIKPSILVVPDELEGDALRLLKNTTRVIVYGEAPNEQPVSAANEWAGTAELITTSYL